MNVTTWIKHNFKDALLFIGLLVAGYFIYRLGTFNPIEDLSATWYDIMLVMAGFLILISFLVTGNPLFGWLINEQNRMSLSRLQMFMWTIVVLSAFVTAAFGNLHFNHFDKAVAVVLPQELWVAMGISTASLVGSGLILENKKVKTPARKRGLKEAQRSGVLKISERPSLMDLIRGEEVGNFDKVDLTRLQNLLFTFVLVGTYMSSIGNMFLTLVTATAQNPNIAANFPITSFPGLGSSAIALLSISHAGYLVGKAIDNQPSAPEPDLPQPGQPQNPPTDQPVG